VERGSGRFILRATRRAGREMTELIRSYVAYGSRIDTDDYSIYKCLGVMGYEHRTVQHAKKIYAEDGVSVNGCEGLFSLLRSFMRVHILPFSIISSYALF